MTSEIAEFLDGPGTEEPEIRIDEPLDMRPDLTELGIIEVERGVCEDNYDNRRIIRAAKLRYQAVYDQFGRGTGLINVFTQDALVERRIMSLAEKKPLLVDPANRNSDYLTGVDLLIEDRAIVMTPPWVVGATRVWVGQMENGGVPVPGRPKAVALPHRCRMIKSDGIRCMLWSSGRMKDDGLCRIHLKVVRKAGDDIERARQKLVQAAPYAVDVLEELMEEAESEPVRLKASTEILDRAGVRGGQDFNIDVQVDDARSASQVVMERLGRLAQGAASNQQRIQSQLEAATEEDQVVDAEVVSETPPGVQLKTDKSPQNGLITGTQGGPLDKIETTSDGGPPAEPDFDDDLDEEART